MSPSFHVTSFFLIVNLIFFPLASEGLNLIDNLSKLLSSSSSSSNKQQLKIINNLDPIPINSSSLSSPSLAEAQYYVHFSGAVYCPGSSLRNWSCPDCIALGPSTSTPLIAIIHNTEAFTKAMVNLNPAKKEIIVTFRGSYNVLNFVEDGLFIQVPLEGPDAGAGSNNKTVRVHAGLLYTTQSLQSQLSPIIDQLLDLYPTYGRISFVGHSLGAAMGLLTLFNYKNSVKYRDRLQQLVFYSYGGPRVGDLDFAYWFHTLDNVSIIRVVHEADVIAHLMPSETGYVHVGTELWIHKQSNVFCSAKLIEDPTCSNSLSPLYNIMDHLQYYWSVDYTSCLRLDPIQTTIIDVSTGGGD